MHAPEAMKPPAALAAAGLEPPPASPFDAPATAEPAPPPDPPVNLNRAQRRRLRAVSLFDARLLGRVAQWDIAQADAVKHDPSGAACYPNERSATYGLERAAKAMRLAKLLTRAEQVRVSFLARHRRLELTRGR